MNFPSFKKVIFVAPAICAILVMQLASGCSSKEPGTATQAYKGVINLEGVKLGLSEESAKSAILSFASDPSVPAPFTQYLSRTYDTNGGQYCLSFMNGKPMQVRVVYSQKPISKEEALDRLKAILPSNSPEETKIDDSEVKAGKKDSPVEKRFYGDNFRAEIIYADKAATTVKLVAVSSLDKVGAGKKTSASATKASGSGSGEAQP